jgi:hypothetical protein
MENGDNGSISCHKLIFDSPPNHSFKRYPRPTYKYLNHPIRADDRLTHRGVHNRHSPRLLCWRDLSAVHDVARGILTV